MTRLYDRYSKISLLDKINHEKEIRRTAERFEKYLNPIFVKFGVDPRKTQIFEFGAGWGRNLLALRLLGYENLRGFDISQEQVLLSRSLGLDSIDLGTVDASLPARYTKSSFNCIILMDVVEHLSLEQIERLAEDIEYLTTADGFIVVQVPNDLAPLNPIRSGDLTHLRAFTPASIRQLFELFDADLLALSGVPFSASGVFSIFRAILKKLFFKPLIQFFFLLLYGKSPDAYIIEPNIMAVGKKRGRQDASSD